MSKTYFLRNVSKKDLRINDLKHYPIQAGKTCNLLDKGSRLSWEEIIKSRESGDLSKKLGKELIEVERDVVAKPPTLREVIREAVVVKFPDTAKSSIVIEVGDIAENIQNITISEEEDFLKQLDNESMEGGGLKIVSDEE
jgi:hypothetical protein